MKYSKQNWTSKMAMLLKLNVSWQKIVMTNIIYAIKKWCLINKAIVKGNTVSEPSLPLHIKYILGKRCHRAKQTTYSLDLRKTILFSAFSLDQAFLSDILCTLKVSDWDSCGDSLWISWD